MHFFEDMLLSVSGAPNLSPPTTANVKCHEHTSNLRGYWGLVAIRAVFSFLAHQGQAFA